MAAQGFGGVYQVIGAEVALVRRNRIACTPEPGCTRSQQMVGPLLQPTT